MSKRQFDANTANPPKKQKNNIDINLEDDVIKYHLMPSLQHASMSNIIITLWNQADIKCEIVDSFNESEGFLDVHIYNLFSKIEDKVLDKLSQLAVPNRMRKILSTFVKPIGYEIFKWIRYQDCCIFNTPYYGYQDPQSICRAIDYIGYLVWTTRGIIDYQETAKTLLAKEEKLLDHYKYYIACEYCLEDNIAIIASKVINTTLTLTWFERQPMVYFWTAHITGDFTELHEEVDNYNRKYSTNYSINECLFNLLINNGQNQVAIKYIWDKLNNEEKSRQLVPAIKNTCNSDIRCFLLSQMSKEQEKKVFQSDDADWVLLSFVDDWLWGQYFLPTIQHIWDIMSGYYYFSVLNDIVIKMKINHEDSAKYNQYRSVFKELWQSAPKHLKEYVFEFRNGYHGPHIFLNLFNKRNKDIIRLILADINDERKKQIMFSSDGIKKCCDYLISNQWDLLEMLIDHTLFSRDVESFKRILIKSKGGEIAAQLIKNKELNKVEQILQWAFKSDDEIKKFKEKLTHSGICKKMLESIVANNKVDFTELECFFKWCVSGDEEKAVKCRAKIPKFCFRTLIGRLIVEDKYEWLEEILNWCFTNDRKHISEFKLTFCEYNTIHEIELLVDIIKQDNQLQSFKKFVYYWCYTDEQINKFKTCILHPSKHTSSVCIRLLYEHLFKLADEFVNWCCNSSHVEIDKFKNQLMIDDFMENLYDADDQQTFYETKVLKWFNPSVETIIRFKEKFIDCWWFQEILPALDNYVQVQQYNQDKDIANVSLDSI